MKQSVLMIRDQKTEAFLPMVMVEPTLGAAERAFLDMVRNERTPLSQHPGDYSLWLVGIVDMTSGQIESGSPVEVLTGASVLSLVKEA